MIYLNITLWNNANTFLTGPGLSHSEILEAAKWNRTREWNWNYVDHFDNTAITQFMSKMTLPLEKLGEKNCLKRKKGQKSEQCHGLQVEAWACLAKKKKVVVRLTKEKWKSHHHRHCLFCCWIVSSSSFSSLSPPSSSCVWEKSDRVDLSSARSGKMGECIFSSKRKKSLKITENHCYFEKSSFQIISINLNVILAN